VGLAATAPLIYVHALTQGCTTIRPIIFWRPLQVCPVCLSATLVYCNGQMDQDTT